MLCSPAFRFVTRCRSPSRKTKRVGPLFAKENAVQGGQPSKILYSWIHSVTVVFWVNRWFNSCLGGTGVDGAVQGQEGGMDGRLWAPDSLRAAAGFQAAVG